MLIQLLGPEIINLAFAGLGGLAVWFYNRRSPGTKEGLLGRLLGRLAEAREEDSLLSDLREVLEERMKRKKLFEEE